MNHKNGNVIPSVEEVLSRYSDMVYRLAYARTMNQQDAEDITQEVFIKYMRYQNELLDEEHRKAWLLTVTANAVKSLTTSSWNQKTTSMEETYELADEKDLFAESEQNVSEVLKVVDQLPEKYRIIIHLFYYEEKTIQSIAEIMKVKEGTVKTQLHRAREILKKKLRKEDYYV